MLEANNSRDTVGALRIVIRYTADFTQLLVLLLSHVTGLLLIGDSSSICITLNFASVEVPDQNVRALIPVVSSCWVIMWSVPNLTEVVVGSCEVLILGIVSLVSFRTIGNIVCTVSLLVVTDCHPRTAVQLTRRIGKTSFCWVQVRHVLVCTIYIQIVLLLEVLLQHTVSTELSKDQVLNL